MLLLWKNIYIYVYGIRGFIIFVVYVYEGNGFDIFVVVRIGMVWGIWIYRSFWE